MIARRPWSGISSARCRKESDTPQSSPGNPNPSSSATTTAIVGIGHNWVLKVSRVLASQVIMERIVPAEERRATAPDG